MYQCTDAAKRSGYFKWPDRFSFLAHCSNLNSKWKLCGCADVRMIMNPIWARILLALIFIKKIYTAHVLNFFCV
jgi:hypothetical protein